MVNPIYNIESNGLLNLLAYDPFGRGGLTVLKRLSLHCMINSYKDLSKYICITFFLVKTGNINLTSRLIWKAIVYICLN